MYIPLGGASWRALNVWAIFTFVALWHDLEWRLLGWAWIMALAMAPEMVSSGNSSSREWGRAHLALLAVAPKMVSSSGRSREWSDCWAGRG